MDWRCNFMNRMLFPEDVTNVIQSFYCCNNGDEDTVNLILAIGAELLDISSDKMLEMVTTTMNPQIAANRSIDV